MFGLPLAFTTPWLAQSALVGAACSCGFLLRAVPPCADPAAVSRRGLAMLGLQDDESSYGSHAVVAATAAHAFDCER